MNKLIPLLICLIAAPAVASTTIKQERLFDIEVLFFKRDIASDKTREKWPNDMPNVDISVANGFDDGEFRVENEIRMLPIEDYALVEQRDKLKEHAGFEVLMHTAWRQNDLNREDAPTFRIHAGQDFADRFYADGSQIEQESDSSEPAFLTPKKELADDLYELDGKLQVYVQHYLFAELELDLRAPSVREIIVVEPETESPVEEETALAPEESEVDENTQETGVAEEYDYIEEEQTTQVGFLEEIEQPEVIIEEFLRNHRIKQKRKMRSSETHYIDHPLMGMIIQVRRVPQDEVNEIMEQRRLAEEEKVL